VEGEPTGLGTLSQRDVVTGSDGRATVVYTAPTRAPDGQLDEATVQILATPIGTNAGNMTGSLVLIQLKSANQDGGPTASFVFSPVAPRIFDKILFDARASAPSTGAAIVGWEWDFGDGNNNPVVPYLPGTGPTISHDYLHAGRYTVVLTVIDSTGRRAQAAKIVFVTD
jgi:PKD repeat protein